MLGELGPTIASYYLLVCSGSHHSTMEVLCLFAFQIHELLLLLCCLPLQEGDFIIHIPCQQQRALSQEYVCRNIT